MPPTVEFPEAANVVKAPVEVELAPIAVPSIAPPFISTVVRVDVPVRLTVPGKLTVWLEVPIWTVRLSLTLTPLPMAIESVPEADELWPIAMPPEEVTDALVPIAVPFAALTLADEPIAKPLLAEEEAL